MSSLKPLEYTSDVQPPCYDALCDVRQAPDQRAPWVNESPKHDIRVTDCAMTQAIVSRYRGAYSDLPPLSPAAPRLEIKSAFLGTEARRFCSTPIFD
jgi:hypothetical protein